jgi:leader peptidase (prepilin peptidase)/N-methyltransferase
MLVELANMLLWIACALLFAPEAIPMAIISSIACSVLLCIAFIDLEHMFIPDRFQILLAALGAAALIISLWYPDGILWWERLVGMAAGGGVFGLIYLAFLWIRKKEGMGLGDVKMVAAAGLLLGPWNLLIAVFAASISASVILIIVQRRQGEEQKEYPFAPFIAAGVAIALLFGQSIQSAYMGLFL